MASLSHIMVTSAPSGRSKSSARTEPKLDIKSAIKHPGALHRDLGVPAGKPIPKKKLKAAEKKGGVVGRRARFAANIERFAHKGGEARKRGS